MFIFLVRKYWQENICISVCISILDKRIFCIYIGISILGKRIFVFPFVFLFPAQPAPSVCSPVLTEAFPSHRSDLISTFFRYHFFPEHFFPKTFSDWLRLQGALVGTSISTRPPLPFFPSLRCFIPFIYPFFFSSLDGILSSASLIEYFPSSNIFLLFVLCPSSPQRPSQTRWHASYQQGRAIVGTGRRGRLHHHGNRQHDALSAWRL